MVSGKAYMTKYDFLTSYDIILGIIPFHLLFLFTPLLVSLFFCSSFKLPNSKDTVIAEILDGVSIV